MGNLKEETSTDNLDKTTYSSIYVTSTVPLGLGISKKYLIPEKIEKEDAAQVEFRM